MGVDSLAACRKLEFRLPARRSENSNFVRRSAALTVGAQGIESLRNLDDARRVCVTLFALYLLDAAGRESVSSHRETTVTCHDFRSIDGAIFRKSSMGR